MPTSFTSLTYDPLIGVLESPHQTRSLKRLKDLRRFCVIGLRKGEALNEEQITIFDMNGCFIIDFQCSNEYPILFAPNGIKLRIPLQLA